eukprot:s492_g4.t2
MTSQLHCGAVGSAAFPSVLPFVCSSHTARRSSLHFGPVEAPPPGRTLYVSLHYLSDLLFENAVVFEQLRGLHLCHHEFIVLATFAISFTLWRHFGRSARQSRKAGLVETPVEKCPVPKAPRVKSSRSFTDQEKEHVKAAEKEMLAFLASCEFTRALNQYRGLQRTGTRCQELFASFVQSAVRVNKADVAERMLRTMRRSGLVPSPVFWQHTMKLLSSRRYFELCLSAYSIFEHLIPADKVTFSCLINAALELNVPDRTPPLLAKFSEANIAPKDYVLHFRCYVALGNVKDAEKLFQQLDTKATTLMLNLLLLTCINCGRSERAFEILQEAHEREQRMKEPLVDIVSYNTVMKGFGTARSRLRCFECMRSLLKHNLQPDDITLGALLDACMAENDQTVASEISELFLKNNEELNRVMCTLLIKGFVRGGGLQKALALFEAMKQASVVPDIIAYSVLIKGLVDQHQLKKALDILEEMKVNGQIPDDIILTHLLEGCRYERNCELGRQIFQDLISLGVAPSDVTFVTLLKLFGRCGAHQERRKPTVIHYTCLMSGCFRTRKYDSAWAAFELMLASGIEPDATTIATMLPGMVASQQWDRVMILARKAFRNASNLPVEALNHALAQMSGSSAPPQFVEELKASMKQAGIRISARGAAGQ